MFQQKDTPSWHDITDTYIHGSLRDRVSDFTCLGTYLCDIPFLTPQVLVNLEQWLVSSYDFVPLLSKNSEKPVRRDRDRLFQNWDQTSNKRKDTSLECQKHQQFSSIHTSFNFQLETLESLRGLPFCVTFKHKENCTLTKLLTWAELHCFQGFES